MNDSIYRLQGGWHTVPSPAVQVARLTMAGPDDRGAIRGRGEIRRDLDSMAGTMTEVHMSPYWPSCHACGHL